MALTLSAIRTAAFALKALCIGLTLHAQVALADTPQALRKSAGRADADMFKPRIGDLYATRPDGSVVLRGNGLTPREGTLQPGDLFSGVAPIAPRANELPDVDRFEDLLPYRDQQLNALEQGQGAYGASGSNVEPHALSVLRGSRNLPSVRAERFLFPSRDTLEDRAAIERDFGDCQVITGTRLETRTSTSDTLERCERQAYDDSPLSAERTYLGPGASFTHSVRDGWHSCSDGRTTTWVQDARTCATLSAFDRVPEAYQILNCAGQPACVDIRLTAEPGRRTMPWLFDYASFRDFCEDWQPVFVFDRPFVTGEPRSICHLRDRAAAYGDATRRDWYPDVNRGQDLQTPTLARGRLAYVARVSAFPDGQSAAATELFPLAVSGTRPLSAGVGNLRIDLARWADTPYNAMALVGTATMDGVYRHARRGNSREGYTYYPANTPDLSLVNHVQPNLMVLRRASDGRYYVLNRQEFLRALTSYAPPAVSYGPDAYPPFSPYGNRLRYPTWAAVIGHPLGTGLPAYAAGEEAPVLGTSFALRLGVRVLGASYAVSQAAAGTVLTYQGAALARGVTPPTRLPGLIDHGGRLQSFELRYLAGPDANAPASVARIVVNLDNTLFTPWVFLRSRWAEIERLGRLPGCSLRYEVRETVSDAGGCINTLNGRLCGTARPVPTPFTGLGDRGATRIIVRPVCERPQDEGGFATLDNCGELRADRACTFVRSECIDDVVQTGACRTFEDTYRCSDTTSWETPVVTTTNICTSNLACMGEDCVLDGSTDGSLDLVDTATKLASVDMMLADMNCGGPIGTPPPGGDARNCEVFKGEATWCARIVLGLSNCCKAAKGVSVYDYIVLAMAVSRLNATVGSLGVSNVVTGTWASLSNAASTTFGRLTAPITRVWEGIVGNTTTSTSAFSLAGVKQALMRSTANWTAATFGPEAASSIFTTAANGTVTFTASVQTVLSAVSVAFTVYAVVRLLSAVVFACKEHEIELSVKRALRATHEVGTYCARRVLGVCLSRRTSYCTFSSPLSRIMNEQIRVQTGRGWGSPRNPDCRGITLGELSDVDMDRVDLSEWTGMLVGAGMLDVSKVADIERMTGTGSTLGQALDNLYPRENAVLRGEKRIDGADFDAIRDHTVEDFGTGVVRP